MLSDWIIILPIVSQIFGWQPEFYNYTDVLPDNMPANIKNRIKEAKSGRPDALDKLQKIWISCEGENPADIENMGAIQYHPTAGFPGYYFPYKNSPGYLSPLVAVYFEKPARE